MKKSKQPIQSGMIKQLPKVSSFHLLFFDKKSASCSRFELLASSSITSIPFSFRVLCWMLADLTCLHSFHPPWVPSLRPPDRLPVFSPCLTTVECLPASAKSKKVQVCCSGLFYLQTDTSCTAERPPRTRSSTCYLEGTLAILLR